jgi:hypothetical protein
MATKKQAVAVLDRLGLTLDPDSGISGIGWFATIDAKGRTQIDQDCRGEAVSDYTAKSAEFWQEVIDRAKKLTLSPCPFPPGECDFHDS